MAQQDVTELSDISPGSDRLIQQPLLLVMPLELAGVPTLKQLLAGLDITPVNAALNKIGTVHSTRLLILEDDDHQWAKLIVAAIYDGSVEAYIAAFARELKLLFNTLFQFVADAPTLPVENNVDEFIEYVKARDVRPEFAKPFSAYPDLTVLDIFESTRPAHDPAPALTR